MTAGKPSRQMVPSPFTENARQVIMHDRLAANRSGQHHQHDGNIKSRKGSTVSQHQGIVGNALMTVTSFPGKVLPELLPRASIPKGSPVPVSSSSSKHNSHLLQGLIVNQCLPSSSVSPLASSRQHSASTRQSENWTNTSEHTCHCLNCKSRNRIYHCSSVYFGRCLPSLRGPTPVGIQ